MKEENKNEASNTLNKIHMSIYLSVPKIGVAFVLGHPWDLLKTRMQSDPYKNSVLRHASEIYGKRGILGFYTAGTSNIMRAVFKETYRAPLRGFLNSVYIDNFELSKDKSAIATGFSMALFDSTVSNPLERFKVWVMTNDKHKDNFLNNFVFKEHDSFKKLYKNLFKGYVISLARSTLSWVSFLYIENKLYEYSKSRMPDNHLSFSGKIIVGGTSGLINGVITLPFDTIKTQVQKQSNYDTVSLSGYVKIARDLCKTHGIFRGLYPGFGVRLFQYTLVGVISSDVIHRIDDVWLKTPQDKLNKIPEIIKSKTEQTIEKPINTLIYSQKDTIKSASDTNQSTKSSPTKVRY